MPQSETTPEQTPTHRVFIVDTGGRPTSRVAEIVATVGASLRGGTGVLMELESDNRT